MARFDDFKKLAKAQEEARLKALAAFEATFLETAKTALEGFECPANCGNPIGAELRQILGTQQKKVHVTGCCPVGQTAAESLIDKAFKEKPRD